MLLPALFVAAVLSAQDLPMTTPAQVQPAGVTAEPADADMKSASAPTSPTSSADADAAIEAGLKEYRRRRFKAAEADFERAVDANPESAAAHYYLGYTIYKLVERRPFHPDKSRAVSEFARAFSLDPSFRPHWWHK
jgi:tetratricopeptide (TPR) repeat protein